MRLLFLLFFLAFNFGREQKCGTSLLSKRFLYSDNNTFQQSKFRAAYQNISSSSSSPLPVVTGTKFDFMVYDFVSTNDVSLPATARVVHKLANQMNLVLWVSDSVWNQTIPNNLNRSSIPRSLSVLQSERQSVLQEISVILASTVIPESEMIFGAIQNPANAYFEGIHFLLYDILDSYDQDGGYVGGYFFHEEQFAFQTPAGLKAINLLHMDLYPLNPGGRLSANSVEKNVFYHTLAHEFQHLIHYQKAGNTSWTGISDWLKEGLAQLSVYRVLNQQLFSDGSFLLNAPFETVDQVITYLEDPFYTYLLDNGSFGVGPGAQYYGLGYLFFVYLWERTGGIGQGDAFIKSLIDEKISYNKDLDAKLISKGLSLNEVFEEFVRDHYFDSPWWGLDFINLGEGKIPLLKQRSIQNVEQFNNTEIATLRNYSVTYSRIHNSLEKSAEVSLNSFCKDQLCGSVCVYPEINFLILPSLSIVKQCQTLQNFDFCMKDQFLYSQKTSFVSGNLLIPPGDSTLAMWTSKIACNAGTAGVKASFLSSSDSLNLFSSLPEIITTNNRMEISFSTKRMVSPTGIFLSLESEGESHILTDPQIIIAQTERNIQIYWYYQDQNPFLYGKTLSLFVNAFEKHTDEFSSFFSASWYHEPKISLQIEKIPFYSGWNLRSFFPLRLGYTLGNLVQDLSLQGFGSCVYLLDKGVVKSLTDSFCQTPLQADKDLLLQADMGFWVFSSSERILFWEGVKPAKQDLILYPGWNQVSFLYLPDISTDSFPSRSAWILGWNEEQKVWESTRRFGEREPLLQPISGVYPWRSFLIYSVGFEFRRYEINTTD